MVAGGLSSLCSLRPLATFRVGLGTLRLKRHLGIGLMKGSSPDDDLRNCLSKQPRRKPQPKREVTSLTFSLAKWQRERPCWYTRPLPSIKQWPWWVWTVLAVGGLSALWSGQTPSSVWRMSRGGPVSTENLANFPPPTPVNEVQTDGQSVVVVTNGAPEMMRIALKGIGKDYVFEVQPCRDCTYTNDLELGRQFCDRGPQQALYVDPGEYEVVVGFGGTIAHFRSHWKLTEKWQYEQCIYGRHDWWE